MGWHPTVHQAQTRTTQKSLYVCQMVMSIVGIMMSPISKRKKTKCNKTQEKKKRTVEKNCNRRRGKEKKKKKKRQARWP